MRGHVSRRRRWLAAAAATAALGGLASTAGALELDNTTDTDILVDSNVHWFNDVRPMTLGDYQVMVYWDSQASLLRDPAPLKVTRRNLTNDALEHWSFVGRADYQLTDTADGHNTVRSAISPADGRIHAAWSTHNDELDYVYSSAGCIDEAVFSDCTWTHTNTQADANHERDFVTYPIFFNGPDGDLYMTYRYGSSVAGDQYLNKYDDDGTWTQIGRVLHGYDQDGGGGAYGPAGDYDPDGGGAIPNSTERGPYIWEFQIDRNDRIHLMWNWRHSGAYSGSGAQEGAYYVYSDDDGSTWNNSDGTHVATTDSDPVNVNDARTRVMELPYNTHFSGYEMELDSRNQPHAVLPASDVVVEDGRYANIRQKHIWRTTDRRWHEDWIEPAGGNSQVSALGDLFFDRGDNAYYIYNKNNLGWSPWNALTQTQAELRFDKVTWQPDTTSGGHMDIQQQSTVTAILTNDYVDVPISTTGTNQVRVRMRNNTEGDDFYVAWTTDTATGWSAGKSQTFTNRLTTNDGSTDRDWRTYTFTITDADWRGDLRDLEIDPIVGTSAESGDEIDIDYIRLTDSSGTIAKQWEFDEPSRVVAAEAGSTDNWDDWNRDTLLPDVSDTWGDASFNVDTQLYAAGSGDGKQVNFTVLEQGAPWFERLSLREFDISGDTVLKFYNFDVDVQGWTATNHISGFGYASDSGANSITGTITGNDSRVMSPDNLGVRLEAAADTLHVRLKNGSTATQAAVCFTTDADQVFDVGKCKTFTVTASSGYTEYTVDMSTFREWTSANTLRRLRIDPADNASSGTFHISRIYIDQT